jgi:hypothetical protein
MFKTCARRILALMSRKRWVLKCNECRAECSYAEIESEGVANYFFPKKPDLPPNFTYKCPNCGHEDTYDRSDLIYQDDASTPAPAVKCSDSSETARPGDSAFRAHG